MVIGRRQPPPPGLLDGLVRRRVLVNLKDGRQAFDGVLLAVDGSWVELGGAVGAPQALLEDRGDEGVRRSVVEHNSFIPVGDIAFINPLDGGNRGVG